MKDSSHRPIALFDLDGTIVPWDMQLLFFNYIIRQSPLRWFLILPFFCCLPFHILRLIGEGTMKRLFLAYLTGLTKEQIRKYSTGFVRDYVLPLCYPEILQRLEKHRQAGDLCILASASPSLYVEEIGKALKFDVILGTDTEETYPFPFFPKMPFGNNKGETKVVRLRNMGYLPEDGRFPPCGGIAYSDSSADMPMLLAVPSAVLVNPSPRLMQEAEGKSWEILTPNRPWKSKTGFILKLLQQLYGLYPPPQKS